MSRKTSLLWLTVVLVLMAGLWSVASASATVDQRSVLAGRVTAQDLIPVGTHVRQGDILVQVETITGAQPAARATADGVVSRVLVRPGDNIGVGDVVARIEVGHN
jgi:biotin carboxyl carrier protein